MSVVLSARKEIKLGNAIVTEKEQLGTVCVFASLCPCAAVHRKGCEKACVLLVSVPV